jgi:hypothetical protein
MAKRARKERWAITVVAEPAEGVAPVPIFMRLRMLLKNALRRYKLRNCGMTEAEGCFTITFEAEGSGAEPVSVTVGKFVTHEVPKYGLKVMGIRGTKPDGSPVWPEDLPEKVEEIDERPLNSDTAEYLRQQAARKN